jgi:uncharacterized protein DUF2865
MSPPRTRRFAHRSGTGARSRAGARAKTATIYVLASLATLGVAGTCGAHYGGGTSPTLNAPAVPLGHAFPALGGEGTPDRVRSLRLADTREGWPLSFFKSLFGIEDQGAPRRRPEQYRRAPKPVPRAAAPADVSPPLAPGTDAPATEVPTTYRTMCVRLCDGYYWPVSFATLKDGFERDERACAQSCSASVALYHYPNPGAEVVDMVSLRGLPYKDLATAFLHRTTYDPNCKCRPHPWEAQAIARHQGYANTSQTRAAAQGQRRAR